MKHYFNPAAPESSKPRWAKGCVNARLQSTLFPPHRTSSNWTPEEEDYLFQRRTERVDWITIATEITTKFRTHRTIQALQARLHQIRKTDPQKASARVRQWERWTSQQQTWLAQEAGDQDAPSIDWNNMALRFETKFGFRRSTHSLKAGHNTLRKGGDLTAQSRQGGLGGPVLEQRSHMAEQP